MPTREELRTSIQTTVQDSSISADFIDLLINEALEDIAARVLLPALETSSTVTSVLDDNEVAMPDNFGRELYGCSVSSQFTQPKILSSMGLMQKRYPAIEADIEYGEIKHVCRRGSSLIYFPVPMVATDITLRYYQQMPGLTQDTASPDQIPSHLQRELICSYALRILFDDIEDGIDGQKVNTARHENKYLVGLVNLEQYFKQGQSRHEPARDGSGGFV